MVGFGSLALRAGLLGGMLLAAAASGAVAQEKVGISSAVNPQATGTPPGGTARQLVIGQEVVFNERIATSDAGQTQLLFLDESSMSIGPNSDLTIDQFVYDPKSGTGKQAMSATRGLLRYVGGKLSKQDGAVTLRTSTATLAVRGGAFILNMEQCPNPKLTPTCTVETQVVFLYGDGISLTDKLGAMQTVTRPGFEITVNAAGVASPPRPAPAQQLAQFTARLDGRSGGSGGAAVIPTNASVAQAATPLTTTLQTPLQNAVNAFASQVNAAAEQTAFNPQPNTAPQIISCASTGGCGNTIAVGNTASGQSVGGNNGPVTQSPPPPPPVTTIFSGQVRSTNGAGTARGFADQSANGQIPYSSGTLSFPPGSPQSGMFSGTFGAVGTLSFPLVPGSATFQGTSSVLGALAGSSFLSADGSFFYASLTPVSQPSQRLFVFGGTPVNSSFYQPTGAGARPNLLPASNVNSNTRVFAFTVQPDAALLSSIPFIRSQAGGNLPNSTVSPFYVVAPPSTAIGDTSTNAAARGMQASLAINGQGANQQSAIAVTAGTIGTQANGQPVFNGQMRGSSLLANGTPLALSAGVGSTVDGNGNSFYGGSTISGFVVNSTPRGATETPLSAAQTTYGFAQPAVPAAIPAGVGANRTTQALSGNFGGLMYTNAQNTPYVLTGGALVSTDAPNNRIQATLSGAPQTAAAGLSAVTMQYGSLTGAAGGQAFIDDNNFAATESAVNPQLVTVNGTTSPRTAQLYLVSSGAAGAPNSILPSGVSFCQCNYLQWGYWGGSLTTVPSENLPLRIDAGNINTWVAGVPTPLADLNSLITQSAKASYAGAAVGSVFNNGASYVAAGGFNGAYNFGTQTGTFAITNFDGHTFASSGSAPLTGANYSSSASGGGFSGKISGTFYGPQAAETGGNFAFQSTVGPAYLASGIFAGKKGP